MKIGHVFLGPDSHMYRFLWQWICQSNTGYRDAMVVISEIETNYNEDTGNKLKLWTFILLLS